MKELKQLGTTPTYAYDGKIPGFLKGGCGGSSRSTSYKLYQVVGTGSSSIKEERREGVSVSCIPFIKLIKQSINPISSGRGREYNQRTWIFCSIVMWMFAVKDISSVTWRFQTPANIDLFLGARLIHQPLA